MVEFGYSPMSLSVALGFLDGDVESWVAGRAVPTSQECQRLAQLFEVPSRMVENLAGLA
jgi:hypothetical protein